MNCNLLRQRLLESEHPDRPGAAESRHLARCVDCQAFQKRLVRLEQLLPLVPTPAVGIPPSLPSHRLLVLPRRPTDGVRRQSARHAKLALAFSLAASLTLFTLGYWAWPPPASSPPTSFAQRNYVTLRDERLRQATLPAQRMAALAHLANELLDEARQLGRYPDRLETLADHFDRLLREDLLREARQLTDQQERTSTLLSLSQQLGRTESEASRLASEWRSRHPRAARQLARIAATAAAVDLELRRLAQA
jgi:hypothetical protein